LGFELVKHLISFLFDVSFCDLDKRPQQCISFAGSYNIPQWPLFVIWRKEEIFVATGMHPQDMASQIATPLPS